jgi:hypothetical protein
LHPIKRKKSVVDHLADLDIMAGVLLKWYTSVRLKNTDALRARPIIGSHIVFVAAWREHVKKSEGFATQRYRYC